MEEKKQIKLIRWQLLVHIEKFLEGPMVLLGFIWLTLIIIELTKGLNSSLETLSIAIWIIFIIDFIISFILAPVKKIFLKKNVLTVISLIIPAFRVLRILRFVRLLRGIRLVKILGSLNRGIKSLAATMSRRGFGYMILLTIIVILAGSAGMFAFENKAPGGLKSYNESLWWTAMMVITVGSDRWPKTAEGRILCYILALYGFTVLGYITATLATFFISQDAEKDISVSPKEVSDLKKEISELKEMIKEIKSN